MADLPRLHPSLSLHLADRALTTLISSSSSPSASSQLQHSPHAAVERERLQNDALRALSSAALSLHDMAGRLGLGSAQRVLVEYGQGGPLLIQTFLDPAAAAGSGSSLHGAGAATADQAVLTPSSSSVSFIAAAPPPATGVSSASATLAAGRAGVRQAALPPRRAEGAGGPKGLVNGMRRLGQDPSDDASEDYDGGHGGKAARLDATPSPDGSSSLDVAPMLVGIVLAASADDGVDARRATARLERVGREIQAQWAVGSAGSD